MLAITDARFQDALVAQAQANGKLCRDFVVPERWRENTPERLAQSLAPLQARGLFAAFPFGSDFSADELALIPVLQRLQRVSASKPRLAAFLLSSLWTGKSTPADEVLLGRLGLDRPHGLSEHVLRRLVLRALHD
jgi:hypothetical protein